MLIPVFDRVIDDYALPCNDTSIRNSIQKGGPSGHFVVRCIDVESAELIKRVHNLVLTVDPREFKGVKEKERNRRIRGMFDALTVMGTTTSVSVYDFNAAQPERIFEGRVVVCQGTLFRPFEAQLDAMRRFFRGASL